MAQKKAMPLFGPFAEVSFRSQLPNSGPYERRGKEGRRSRKLITANGPKRGVALLCAVANNLVEPKGGLVFPEARKKAIQPASVNFDIDHGMCKSVFLQQAQRSLRHALHRGWAKLMLDRCRDLV